MADVYTYRVRDKQGKIVEGTLESDSTNLVANKLRQMGYVPLAIDKKATGGVRKELHLMKPKVKLKDIAVFSRQFAVMIDSGLSLLRALTILEEQTENKALAKVVTEVRADVEKGSALSQALAKHPKSFNRLYVSMVRAGETGGSLDSVLVQLADTIEKQVELRQKIKSAMTYPVAVLCLVVLIVTAMLIFIVPMFKDLYADLGGTLPLPTRLLLLISSVLVKAMPIVILAVVGAAIAFRRWIASEKGRGIWDAFKLKVPVFGKLVQLTALARFSRTLASLLRAGVPLLESLEITSGTVGNTVVSNAIIDVQDGVRQGETMAERLKNHDVYPSMVVQMISVGEETGAVDTMLDKIAAFYEQEIEATVDALTSLLEPALIVVLGGAVGGMVISLYMPMFNIIKLIQ
ncbi:MAG: type II secretion system F family protein [Actinomycetota bacterium]|nr:type II secretion system F family protein [Actinomycetota bacterium]MDQ3678936.1 type II secretion system F family protein [Actinomycetota bacterium]